jgi:hypothetical protein
MNGMRAGRGTGVVLLLLAAALGAAAGPAAGPANCRLVELKGEVKSGTEWRARLGMGWVFRLVPITAGSEDYTGWDLVVDREEAAGFPDALLVATPPWDSISEREIGTTYGLRAQDAIGWNPRSFHFLTDPAALVQAQQLYRQAMSGAHPGSKATAEQARAGQQLLALGAKASAGELRIEDARLAPGLADPAPFAMHWALAAARTAHTQDAPLGGKQAGAGQLRWMRFTVKLWLPAGWRVLAGTESRRTPCGR